MSYVGDQFENDIFISYSHGDPLGNGASYLAQWSHSFKNGLEQELNLLLGQQSPSLRIYMDADDRDGQGLDPSSPLVEQLKETVGGSAILLPLICDQYLNSEWCGKERDWWAASCRKTGFEYAERSVLVQLMPNDTALWPDQFRDSERNTNPGRIFYDRSKPRIQARAFGWPDIARHGDAECQENLVVVAGDLKMRLDTLQREMKRRQDEERNISRLSASTGQVIYLHGRDTQRQSWDKTADQLTDEGFAVLPVEPERVETDPIKRMDIRNTRQEIMSGCDAILLLGSEDGPALSADVSVIGHQDRKAAVARSESDRPLPCGVLDLLNLAQLQPKWRKRVASFGLGWVEATPEVLSPPIHEWLRAEAEL